MKTIIVSQDASDCHSQKSSTESSSNEAVRLNNGNPSPNEDPVNQGSHRLTQLQKEMEPHTSREKKKPTTKNEDFLWT
jgi:hypothetical protein